VSLKSKSMKQNEACSCWKKHIGTGIRDNS
jgi:hypothetical protein